MPPSPSPPRFCDSANLRHHAYNRKQKSLGLLCTNFVSLYDRVGVESIGLDDAARRLGVERRRIYDIVNVMESVGVLARKAKNRYSWIGFKGIPRALDELKAEGLRDISCASGTCSKIRHEDVADENDDESLGQNEDEGDEKLSQTLSSSSSALVLDNRREKSLGLLTRNFVKLFLTTNVETVSLDEAARLLIGDMSDASYMRTKVRRLYDIANVLSAMNIIEKVQVEARKPAFRWLGTKGDKPRMNTGVTVATAPAVKQFSKRAFGTEITNYDLKKSRLDYAPDKKAIKYDTCEDVKECKFSAQKQLGSNNSYVFGPFRPVGAIKDNCFNKEKDGNRIQDWESLASSLRPQYHNQALSDLFAHYAEAWKSWFVEVAKGSGNLMHR